jgi:cytochrome c oxidase subunit 1
MTDHADAGTLPNFYEVKGRYPGIFAWIFSTDHKRIGILYTIAMTIFFLIGATFGIMMRLELIAPGKQFLDPQTYNAFFTLHGMIMIFLFVIPGLSASFGNIFLPIQIGAEDVAFPRLNLLSWWLFMTGGLLAFSSLFTAAGPPDTGWTFYAPYSLRSGTNIELATFAAFILGFSSILTGLNFVTTIHRMRAPGMSWFRMPLFPWSLYATGWIQVLATPIVGITFLLVIAERYFGIGVFDPAKGGDPILFQHLFWIYSHPAVYVMILPAMGVISEIIPVYARRTIFGYKFIAYSSIAIAGVGSLVWGHHLFVSGQSYTAGVAFSLLTFIVAIPSAIKVFNWVATLYKGSIAIEAALLWAMSFIFLFSIGGFTGLLNGALAVDVHVHDTYFVVGHFHYWLIVFIGFNSLYFPMLVLGWLGMPRRYYDYLPEYQSLHVVSTIGSWILVTGVLIVLVNLLRSLRTGEKTGRDPWGGTTLEWTVPSPPPLLNFEAIPTVDRGPYEFQRVGK